MMKPTRGVWVAVAAIALIATAILAGWLVVNARQALNTADAGHARDRGQPIPVRTARVEPSPADKVIGATSLTTPSRRASISIEASRRIPGPGGGVAASALLVKEVLVKHGEPVRAGQVLVELHDKSYGSSARGWEAIKEAAVKEVAYREKTLEANKGIRELDVTKAEAEVKFRTADIDSRTKIRDALKNLSETGAAREVSFYEACANLAQAELGMTVAKLDLLRAKLNLTTGLLNDEYALGQAVAKRDEALAMLEQIHWSREACRVRSPLDGFAGEVNVVAGAVVDIDAPLLQVFQLDPIWICMDFPQERIGELSIGQEAEVVVDSYPREIFSGKVVALLPQVRPETRVLPVYIEVANPGARIKAGVSGFARISTAAPQAVTVPATAVLQTASRAMVFRIRDGRALATQVETGPLVKTGVIEICTGLAPGDEVVVFGNVDLKDGDVVNTDWRKWTRRE